MQVNTEIFHLKCLQLALRRSVYENNPNN